MDLLFHSILGWVKKNWTEVEVKSKSGNDKNMMFGSPNPKNVYCVDCSIYMYMCAHAQTHTQSTNLRVMLGSWMDHTISWKYL